VVNHIQALTKAKAQIPNPKFQSTKDGFIVFGIWSLELGISMFFPSKRRVEFPARAFTEVGYASLRSA
jgi:hypothetical protein